MAARLFKTTTHWLIKHQYQTFIEIKRKNNLLENHSTEKKNGKRERDVLDLTGFITKAFLQNKLQHNNNSLSILIIVGNQTKHYVIIRHAGIFFGSWELNGSPSCSSASSDNGIFMAVLRFLPCLVQKTYQFWLNGAFMNGLYRDARNRLKRMNRIFHRTRQEFTERIYAKRTSSTTNAELALRTLVHEFIF